MCQFLTPLRVVEGKCAFGFSYTSKPEMNPELELNTVSVDFLQANHFILKTKVGSKKLNKLYHIKRKIKKLHATVSPAMYIHTSSKLI